MFRITQTFLVNALVTYLRKEGWDILFENYVNARRGGAGSQGAINYCFEIIFDQFPDVVAVKEKKMLLIEVDLAYKHGYVEKLKTFKSMEHKLFQCIQDKLGLDLETSELGLVLSRRPSVSKVELAGFHVWLYNKRLKKFIIYK